MFAKLPIFGKCTNVPRRLHIVALLLYVSGKEVIRNVNFSKLDAVIYKKFDELLKNKNKAFKKKHRGP